MQELVDLLSCVLAHRIKAMVAKLVWVNITIIKRRPKLGRDAPTISLSRSTSNRAIHRAIANKDSSAED